jgi:hypothetical protein
LFCLVAGCSAIGSAEKDAKEDLITVGEIPKLEEIEAESGAGVLLRCEKAYANLPSLKGTISTKGRSEYGDAGFGDEGEIEFLFEAPRKLRLETTVQNEKIVIVSDGTNHAEMSPFSEHPPNMKHGRIEEPLTANQGILKGATVRLPAVLVGASFRRENLFLPNGKLLPALATKAELAGDEELNGLSCYRVVCERSIGTWTLWIDKKEMLIRRIDLSSSEAQMLAQKEHGGGGFSGRITAMHQQEVFEITATNADIDDDLFRVADE